MERQLYQRLLKQARPYWWYLVALLLMNLIGVPLSLLQPVPLKILVDNVLGSQPFPPAIQALLPQGTTLYGLSALLVPPVLFVLVLMANQIQQLASTAVRVYAFENMVLQFRAQLFDRCQRLSLAYHDRKTSADSVYKIQFDAVSVSTFVLDGVIPFLTSALMLAGIVAVTTLIDWKLLLVALTAGPLMALCTILYKRRIRGPWHRTKEYESAAMAVVQEVLGALRVVKVFGRQSYERDRFVQESKKCVRLRIKVSIAEGFYAVVLGFLMGTGIALTFFIGTLHVRSGAISLGQLLILIMYLLQMAMPLQTLLRKVGEMQGALVSAERAFALLDEPTEVIDSPDARPLVHSEGKITFRHVFFGYGTEKPTLDDISFEAPAGSCVGVVGKTGAGKSTLVSLLVRCYDPGAGQILIDDSDIREYRLQDLREQFAFVLQDSVLFSTTVAENIGYGRPGATESEIVEAAKNANAHDFICALPEGYKTMVGERGMTLSGGERQRIALARAFLKDAPILVLDEPTSAVDVKTEAQIIEAIERLLHGRTTFIIAHRASTLRNCDLVLNIENGRLVDPIAKVGQVAL